MRKPHLSEVILFVVTVVVFFVVKSELKSDAANELEYKRLVENRDYFRVQNDSLRNEKVEVDRIAADSFAILEVVIADAEREITVIAAVGRQTFVEIIEVVSDTMPELRILIEEREELHIEEVDSLNSVVGSERSAANVLRGQLTISNNLLAGVESELVLANDQIVFLESLRDDGLNNLESAGIGVSAYLISTEFLKATTFEGVVIGGGTFLVVKGGSKLLSWIF